jgi:serpin B
MEIANSIWVKDIFQLRREFADKNRNYYDAEINSLDFDDPASVNIINNWVKDKTNEKISTILDQIPPEAAMYLINAIYYFGTWKYEFDENDNQPISFKYADGTRSSLEGMRQQENFQYYDAGNHRMLELPYGNEKYSMVILLPESGYTPSDIANELSLETWQNWIDSLSEKEVKLHMPKFKFEYKSLLNNALKEMGLGEAFESNADFPHMIEEPAELYLSRVLHKTFVDVNEEGTEAAAVTAVEIGVTSVGGSDNVVHFTVNRPFVFVIRERTSNALIFMGKVGSPEYN